VLFGNRIAAGISNRDPATSIRVADFVTHVTFLESDLITAFEIHAHYNSLPQT
jgi:hypothetical protein